MKVALLKAALVMSLGASLGLVVRGADAPAPPTGTGPAIAVPPYGPEGRAVNAATVEVQQVTLTNVAASSVTVQTERSEVTRTYRETEIIVGGGMAVSEGANAGGVVAGMKCDVLAVRERLVGGDQPIAFQPVLPPVADAPIYFLLTPMQSLAVVEDGKVGESDLLPGVAQSWTKRGVAFRRISEDTLRVEATGTEAVVRVDGYAGWQVRVPQGDVVDIRVDGARRLIDLETPAANPLPILLSLPDGARAEMGASSFVRYDVFKDQTYYLAGQGSVRALDASGQTYQLSVKAPPMSGGQLVQVTGSNGTQRMEQRTAETDVMFYGLLGSGAVGARVGTQNYNFAEGKTSQTVVLDNGSILKLGLDRARNTLTWEVVKGYFTYSFEGVEGWQGIGLTGQSAAQQWDIGTRTADARNLASASANWIESTLLVGLRNSQYAVISPGATFQYGQLESQGGEVYTYRVTGIGGDIFLHNAATGEDTKLDAKSVVMVGTPKEVIADGMPDGGKRLIVQGDYRSSTEVSGELGRAELTKDAPSATLGEGDNRIQIIRFETGEVAIEAESGRYLIVAAKFDNATFGLKQGNKLGFNIDSKVNMVTVRSSSGNAEDGAYFSLVGGTRVPLPPGSIVTLMAGRNGVTLADSRDTTYILEPAGSPPSTILPPSIPTIPRGPGPLPPNDPIDVTRIVQNPQSVLR